jgi:hypothetical protein
MEKELLGSEVLNFGRYILILRKNDASFVRVDLSTTFYNGISHQLHNYQNVSIITTHAILYRRNYIKNFLYSKIKQSLL